VTSGVVGGVGGVVPSGGGGASKQNTEGVVVTGNTVGKVLPLSVERAKNTLNMSVPSRFSAPVACSQTIFTLLLESTAICGKAGATEPEGAIFMAGVKLLPVSV